MKRRLVLVAHNIRSCHNVGSIFRTADAMGVEKLYLTGYTPYPALPGDSRLPHETKRIASQIQKTALGAENSVPWEHYGDIFEMLEALKHRGFEIAALEQTENAVSLDQYTPTARVALVVGNEIDGLDKKITKKISTHLQILMLGSKESLNVAAAASIALYHLRYAPFKD